MGTCNCGRNPPVISPQEKLEQQLPAKPKPVVIQRQYNIESSNNYLLYALIIGVIAIIFLLLNRKCE
jgi:hypothetical protein